MKGDSPLGPRLVSLRGASTLQGAIASAKSDVSALRVSANV